MTGHQNHDNPKTYECVDKNPEYVSGHNTNTDGALFYFVIPDCSGAGSQEQLPIALHMRATNS